MQFIASSLTRLPDIAWQILSFATDTRILLFYGDMGAGKTTLIKSLCKNLGVTEPVTSPTFSIVNEYRGSDASIYHFDFYRIKDQTEALDMGYEEYFYSGAWCFVEWPDKIAGLLPDHYVSLTIKIVDATSREIIMEKM
jgi:tRNA threonylcarbamoyladenosine biosynthesis protein TsaE